jgi:hypothetical protein
MTAVALDPGRTAPQAPPHPGDVHAQRIRAALERVKAPLEPHHAAARQRTDEEQAALGAVAQ